MSFATKRKFKCDYDLLYRKDPAMANVFLSLFELADNKGRVLFDTPFPETEIKRLMVVRFDDPLAYQLPGGAKR